MKVIPREDTTLTVSKLADMAKNETVIVTREGRPLVAVKDESGSD
jgi:hypothetical protein